MAIHKFARENDLDVRRDSRRRVVNALMKTSVNFTRVRMGAAAKIIILPENTSVNVRKGTLA